jgi:hypothetical protein
MLLKLDRKTFVRAPVQSHREPFHHLPSQYLQATDPLKIGGRKKIADKRHG